MTTETADILDTSGHTETLSALPQDIAGLCEIVQGLLIHDGAVSKLYGEPPPGLKIDRETRPVAERLDTAQSHGHTITDRRAPFERQVGTCRDFAAMLCAFARHAGYRARVRCGYALYFGTNAAEDHWVVEYRAHRDSPWRLADAQMDAAHRDHYGIDFAASDVPRERFLTAHEAWRLWRTGGRAATHFGHGDYRGEKFILVNLMRDAFALSDVLRSSWDAWRDIEAFDAPLSGEIIELGDRICQDGLPAIGDTGLSDILASLHSSGN